MIHIMSCINSSKTWKNGLNVPSDLFNELQLERQLFYLHVQPINMLDVKFDLTIYGNTSFLDQTEIDQNTLETSLRLSASTSM